MIHSLRFAKAVLSYLSSWLVIAVTLGLIGAFIVWFEATLAMSVAAVVLGLGLLALWPKILASGQGFQHNYHRLATRVDQDDLAHLYRLEGKLRQLGAADAAAQLRNLRDRFDTVSRLLVRRLHSREIAYTRYLHATEQVFLNSLDNVAGALRELPGSGNSAASGVSVADQPAGRAKLGSAFEQVAQVVQIFADLSSVLSDNTLRRAYAQEQHKPVFDRLESLARQVAQAARQ